MTIDMCEKFILDSFGYRRMLSQFYFRDISDIYCLFCDAPIRDVSIFENKAHRDSLSIFLLLFFGSVVDLL